jgi:hypothetical protein
MGETNEEKQRHFNEWPISELPWGGRFHPNQFKPTFFSLDAARYERETSNAGRQKLDLPERYKCLAVLLILSLAGNQE